MINIKVGVSPSAININPNTNMMYVANNGDDTLSVLDGSTNNLVVG